MLLQYTPETLQALADLRDLSNLEWYVIPLLAVVFYVYTNEMKKAKETKNWNILLSGLTLFGMDFINETWNGWVMVLSNYSACWTTPGPTALRTMVGWNIEIMFMFLMAGIIYANSIDMDKNKKILGISNHIVLAIGYAAFCVFIECVLNLGGLLIWEYPFWNLSFTGIWLIFFIGYLTFFLMCMFVIRMKKMKNKILTIVIIYAIAIGMNIFGMGIMGWVY